MNMRKTSIIFSFLIILLGNLYAQSNQQIMLSKDCLGAKNKYLQVNPDVAKAGMDAWVHYSTFGQREGRNWYDCNGNLISGDTNKSTVAQTAPASTANGSMIKLGNYELEFSKEKKSWSELNEYCRSKGKGWFIPSPDQMQIIVSKLNIPQTMVLWTSKEAWSGNSTTTAGKQWSDSDMDVAEVFDMSSKTIESKYKTDRCDFVIARSFGSGLEKVKSSLSEAYVIGDLTVSKYELRDLNFAEAQSLCNSLGDGWRLPSIKELEQIALAGRTAETDLSLSFYYSSDRTCSSCYDSYWAYNISNSKKIMFDNHSSLRVIPVKSNNSSQSNSLTTWNFGDYVVTKQFFGPMTFAEAENFCANQSTGPYNPWRITTMSQLSSMKAYKNEIPGMVGKRFMSYEYKTQHFERNDMSTIKIEQQGVPETWMAGSETSKFYFFMAKRNLN
jgi:hypothetical protein